MNTSNSSNRFMFNTWNVQKKRPMVWETITAWRWLNITHNPNADLCEKKIPLRRKRWGFCPETLPILSTSSWSILLLPNLTEESYAIRIIQPLYYIYIYIFFIFKFYLWVCHNQLLWHWWWKRSMGQLCLHCCRQWPLLARCQGRLSFLLVDNLLCSLCRSSPCIPLSFLAATGQRLQSLPGEPKHCSQITLRSKNRNFSNRNNCKGFAHYSLKGRSIQMAKWCIDFNQFIDIKWTFCNPLSHFYNIYIWHLVDNQLHYQKFYLSEIYSIYIMSIACFGEYYCKSHRCKIVQTTILGIKSADL